jgi:hypothetical protein
VGRTLSTPTRRRIASVLASERDTYLATVERRLARSHRIGSLAELEAWIPTLAEAPATDTLDLIAHSTTDDRLLALGTDLLDTRRPTVHDGFVRMKPGLQRSGITTLRLLGCGTATRPAGRRTIRELALLLAPIRIYGTRDLVPPWAFDTDGLCRDDEDLLVAASDLMA